MKRAAQAGGRARIALGFRVKSGYAVAVVLRGSASIPEVAARLVVELSDPASAETRQPYHDGFYTAENDPRELARRLAIVRRCTTGSVDALLRNPCVAGLPCSGAGLVVGSVRDPTQIKNPHIQAHAREGQLFRTVLADALRAHGIVCEVIVEKAVAAQAAQALHLRDDAVRRTLASLGKPLGGPWRADEKAACAAAWWVLSRRTRAHQPARTASHKPAPSATPTPASTRTLGVK
jgi:hypothetical protein